MNKMDIKREDGTFSYSSTEVDVEEPLRTVILDFNKQFINESDLHEYGLETRPHMTALYGLHTTDPSELESVVRQFDEVTAYVSSTSIFETSPDYDVVKFDIVSPDLVRLNRILRDTVTYTNEFEYHPHLTIAYVKKGTGKKYVGNDEFMGKKIVFKKLIFSPKDGDDTILYFNIYGDK